MTEAGSFMQDENETPSAAAADAPPPPRAGFLRRHWGKVTILLLVLIPLAGMSAWVGVTLNVTYSDGIRTGFVQKLSRKGWVCKSWEGELAMTTQPGTAPQIFHFSVRNDSIARAVEAVAGSQVTLHYREHRGVPTSCFGETAYFVDSVKVVK